MRVTWSTDPGGLLLPSGRAVRGRRLSTLPCTPGPDFGVYLARRRPPLVPWPSAWIHWPDFWVPTDPVAARAVILDLYARLDAERCEVACGGGRGRTGTVLAALTVLDGLTPPEAVRWVRERYHPRAVETLWQQRFLREFAR